MRKRGIRIQTRIIISAIMILIQLLCFALLVYTLSSKLLWVYSLVELLGAVLSVIILSNNSNPAYKLPWITFILIVPIVGVTAYLLWGGERVMPHIKRRLFESNQLYSEFLSDDSEVKSKLLYEDMLHSRQAEYLTRESGFPLYGGSSAEYLSPGEKLLPRLLAELEKAEKYIFIEFFILAEGEMWDQIHDCLLRKVKSGVEVKIIFDDFGSIKRQHKGFVKRLKDEGIEVSIFNKIRPSVDIFMNNRNHRKIIVIDGKTALTGGVNIADEYANYIERFGYWMDCGALIHGDAVKSFTIMFMRMWQFTTGETLDGQKYICSYSCEHDGFILPYCDAPLDGSDAAEGIYTQIINTAQRYVYIVTPYLIIDSTMINALTLAAKSGIDVRIITPKKWDKWYVHPVTQQNYEPLLRAGVKIYEYAPGFIHSKLFVSDDSVATVGTVNMDYRSFYIHFECGAWICKSRAVGEIRNHIDEILKDCEEITLARWQRRPVLLRIKQRVLSLFSPFL